MNENIDLTKILKNCPKGTEFWSPMLGDVQFICIDESKIIVDTEECSWEINSDSTVQIDCFTSVEPMLFPSREQRDWSKFTAPWYKKEKFDPKTLKPFDRVLVRNFKTSNWRCEHFSHFDGDNYNPCIASCRSYAFCVPYNDDTKHLVGTTEEAPEYYRYWED